MNKFIITTYSNKEAISECVTKSPILKDDFKIVTLNDILNKYDIFDELSDKGPIIRWFENNKIIASNLTHAILNRVTFIPDHLFNEFIKEDKEYAKREFEAYVGFAFNSFSGVSNNCPRGLCSKILSLPEQWQKLSNLSNVFVPQYYWGPQKFNPLRSDKIVYSDIYDFYNWSCLNTLTNYDKLKYSPIFCFERPTGLPVFTLNLGSEILFTTKINLSKYLKQRIIEISKFAHSLQDSFISEALFFVENNTIFFGCINPEIIASKKNQNFDKFISKYLLVELRKCLN